MSQAITIFPKLLIHCQYVYGIGHLVRTLELARGLSEHFEVSVISGGEPVKNYEIPKTINFIQLPAIYKEEDSPFLTPINKSTSIEQCFKDRKKIINFNIEQIKPEILITEHFPFGLLFENEVIDLMNEVKKHNNNVKIVSSVRDIIDSSNGGKRDGYICEIINKWFDLILVHGDLKFTGLSHSFSKINEIKVKIIHTGYIVRHIQRETSQKNSVLILVAVAGGRMGTELLDAAINSHLTIRDKLKHRLVLFSGAFQEDLIKLNKKISTINSSEIELHEFNSQTYLNYLSEATLVLSLGGYNSIIESLSLKKRMLVYKRGFKGGNEEQDLRIDFFEKNGNLNVITPNDLTTEKLSKLILQKITDTKESHIELDFNGIKNSKQALINLIS
jgi:predicted glycosyltransferase